MFFIDILSFYVCFTISDASLGFTDLLSFLQRIRIEGIKCDAWFKKNYVTIRHGEEEDVNLDDVRAVFDDIEVGGLCFYFLP